MATELALPTEQQARTLTDRIKVAVEGTWLLIQEAYTSRVWAVLGYESWDTYCSAEFGTSRLRLPREERQEVVASLRESGLSIRAIAAATGAGVGTVHRELATVPDGTVGPVQGVNGKTYAPHPAQQDADPIAGDDWTPEPAPEPKVKRRPLPEAFTDAARDLTRATERLERLGADDRFSRNQDATRRQVPDLLGALERTTTLVTALDLPAADASEEARRWWATSLHKIADALHGVATSIEQEH